MDRDAGGGQDDAGRPLIDLAARLRATVIPLARQLRAQRADAFTPTQASVIGSINRHGPIGLGELATRERLSLPTISKVVTLLETSGLVERLADARDRRVCLVQSTAAGKQRIEEGRAVRNAWLAERLEGLSGIEQDALIRAVPLLEHLIEDE